MDPIIFYEMIAVGLVFFMFQLLFGFFLQQGMGAFLLGVSAAVAVATSVAIAIGGYALMGGVGAWLGLLVGVLLALPLVALSAKLLNLITGISIVKGVRRFMIRQWFGFCGLAIFGHLAGGWVGLLTISLPAAVLFWTGLLRTSEYTLPLRDGKQRWQVFRSLLTFIMGTNYPYYFVQEDELLHKQVDGNPLLAFLAGPGIVYTDCDHAVYASDSVFKNRVFEPGLNFTGTYDLEPRIVDLRPQFRRFTVSALTRDDIRIGVEILVQFKVNSNGRKVKLGQPFPLNYQAIQAAVTSDLIENAEIGYRKVEKYEWDGQLVNLIATPIVQDIISRYNVDDWCGPNNPRQAITGEVLAELTKAMKPAGILILSAELGNLLPQDKVIVEERLRDWRTQWESKILGRVDAETYQFLLELDQARTEAELISVMAKIAKNSKHIDNPLLLRLMAELGEIVEPSRRR